MRPVVLPILWLALGTAMGRPEVTKPVVPSVVAMEHAGYQALLQESRTTKDAKRTASRLSGFALSLENRKQFQKAETLHREAVKLVSENPGGPEYADVVIALAEFLARRNRLDEAEKLFEQVLSIRESHMRDSMTAVAVTVVNLAGVALERNQYRQAEKLLWRALRLYETALGQSHPVCAGLALRIADLYRKTGRESEADDLERQVEEQKDTDTRKVEALLKPGAPAGSEKAMALVRGLNDFGRAMDEKRRTDDAERLYRRALELAGDAETVETAVVLGNLGMLVYRRKAYAEAERLMKLSLEIRRKLGENREMLAAALGNYAVLLSATGRDAEAEDCLKQAVDIFEQTHGLDYAPAQLVAGMLRELYEAQGRADDLKALERRVRRAETRE
jgi:tetratricopeptide (TPR) repeat protein